MKRNNKYLHGGDVADLGKWVWEKYGNRFQRELKFKAKRDFTEDLQVFYD